MAFNEGASSRSTILQSAACLSPASQAELKPPITTECHRAETTTALHRLGDGHNGAKRESSYGFASLLVFKVVTLKVFECRSRDCRRKYGSARGSC
jgi:hypothetical protein